MFATLPAEIDGLGLESLHDFVVGMNRMGRGDGSKGLSSHMHLFRVWATGQRKERNFDMTTFNGNQTLNVPRRPKKVYHFARNAANFLRPYASELPWARAQLALHRLW
jgi:hypothetical protein